MATADQEFADRVKGLWEGFRDPEHPTYDAPLRDHIHFHSASFGPPARATFRGVVAQTLCNGLGNLHGGCASTLIDVLTSMISMGYLQTEGFPTISVTRSLDVKFLRPVPCGVEMEIICELATMGKKMVMLKAEIRRVDNGNLCVIGIHDKAIINVVKL